ncbi:MAG TPA: protein translocase subunit SecF [Candidatus Paceibacterota bacterium]|nr:protein translocase subunit SecF [Candidatus Paceibacterota bacterium]
MFIVTHRKAFYLLSALLIGASLAAVAAFGLNFGIDFKGGSIMEVQYTAERPDIEVIKLDLDANPAFRGYSVRPTGEKGYILRTPFLEGSAHADALAILSRGGTAALTETRFDAIGPTVGKELRTKALFSILLVIVAIVLFIAFAFRKVSAPVSSWKYGLMAVVGLAHDVIIPVGLFAVLGHYSGAEIDTLFVTALLVILGFSIHDTIVVFDRVRENLRRNAENRRSEPFEETVGKSISQTFNRSINTSLTTVLALVALYFFGSHSTQYFSLALLVGIIAGTYSSIFIASPLLVTAEAWQRRK